MRQFERQAYATPIILAGTAYAPDGKALLGARTHVMTIAGLGDLEYRQGPKIDFGADFAEHPRLWAAAAAVLPASAPTAGGLISLFLGFSHHAGAGFDNPGNLSGFDAAYTGYGAAASDADEMIAQLVPLGSRPLSADAVVQIAHFNLFQPRARYACPLLKNGSDQDFAASAVSQAIRFTPILEGYY